MVCPFLKIYWDKISFVTSKSSFWRLGYRVTFHCQVVFLCDFYLFKWLLSGLIWEALKDSLSHSGGYCLSEDTARVVPEYYCSYSTFTLISKCQFITYFTYKITFKLISSLFGFQDFFLVKKLIYSTTQPPWDIGQYQPTTLTTYMLHKISAGT